MYLLLDVVGHAVQRDLPVILEMADDLVNFSDGAPSKLWLALQNRHRIPHRHINRDVIGDVGAQCWRGQEIQIDAAPQTDKSFLCRSKQREKRFGAWHLALARKDRHSNDEILGWPHGAIKCWQSAIQVDTPFRRWLRAAQHAESDVQELACACSERDVPFAATTEPARRHFAIPAKEVLEAATPLQAIALMVANQACLKATDSCKYDGVLTRGNLVPWTAVKMNTGEPLIGASFRTATEVLLSLDRDESDIIVHRSDFALKPDMRAFQFHASPGPREGETARITHRARNYWQLRACTRRSLQSARGHWGPPRLTRPGWLSGKSDCMI
eukprot:m.155565 g.155565  ORF g.155565 m.155565 type:complete len:328 (+) comp9797_c0_seq34:232-1215(+)